MTATNMCYNFVGFGCSPPLVHIVVVKKRSIPLTASTTEERIAVGQRSNCRLISYTTILFFCTDKSSGPESEVVYALVVKSLHTTDAWDKLHISHSRFKVATVLFLSELLFSLPFMTSSVESKLKLLIKSTLQQR